MQEQTGKNSDLRVLLVDDEESQIELTKLNLASVDPSLNITETFTASEALKLLSSQPFDCIVSDYQMQEINGIQLCSEIRKTTSTPFIIYTGRGSEEVASAAFAAGADDYVRKEPDLAHFQVLARRIRYATERHQNTELYQVGIEKNREGVAIISGTEFLYANQAMADILGVSNPTELAGQSIMRWVATWDRDSVERRTLNRQRGGNEPGVFYYSIKRADGEVRLMHASASIISYRGRTASIVFNHDDTEQRRMERDFEQNEERFKLVLKSAPVSLAEQDRDLRFTWAYNQRSVDPREVIGKRDEDIFTPEDTEYLVALKCKVIESGKEVHEEAWLTVNGKRVYLELIIVPTLNDAGVVSGIEIATVDITKQKLADDETRRLLLAVQFERDRLSALVRSMPDEVWFADPEGKFTLANPTALKEFGLSFADPSIDVEKFAQSLQIYRPDGSPRPVEEAPPLRALKGEIIRRQEEIVETPSTGELRHRSVSAAPVRDVEGKIIGSVSVVRDITDKILAEQKIQASNEKLIATYKKLEETNEKLKGTLREIEAYYDTAPIGLAVLSEDLRYIRVNKWLARLNRLAPEQHIGHTIREIVPFMADQAYEIWNKIKKTGEPILDVEFSSEAAESSPSEVRTFRMSWYPVKNEGGLVSGFNIVVNEITETKRIEVRLHESNMELEDTNEELAAAEKELKSVNEQIQEYNNRLESLVNVRTEQLSESMFYARSLLEASLDPLVTISRDGRITDVNEATVQITGVPREQLVGSDFSDYFTEPAKARIGYSRVFEEGQVRDYPLIIRHNSGKLTEVLYNATVYKNPNGEVEGVFAAARDISQQRSLEEKLHRTEVIAAVEQIGATVAHDLRGPLGLIVQSIQMAKKDPALTPRMLNLAEESAVRSLKMIADWRSSTREIKPQIVHSDVGALVKSVLTGITIPPIIQVTSSIEDGLDSVKLDPDIMHRVVDNLVKNAFEAMPTGGKLSIHVKKVENHLIISVEDTGVGIPEESKEKIWSPLFTTKTGGMGLGLTYSRRAVEAMGGTIDFESQVGRGTIFTIKLPIVSVP